MFKPQFRDELFALLRQAESHDLELQEEAKKYLDPASLPLCREGRCHAHQLVVPTLYLCL